MKKVCAVSAVLAGASVFLMVPAAHAEEASASHQDTRSIYTRTVDNTTPKVGDTVTYTQEFKTTSGKDYIYNWKNNINSCLKYVPDSATLKVGDADPTTIPADKVTAESKHTQITTTDAAGYWTFSDTQPYTFSLQYEVTKDCQPEQKLESGFTYTYGSYFSTKTYAPEKFQGGPSITVADASKITTTLTLKQQPEKIIELGKPVMLEAKLEAAEETEGAEEAESLAGKKVTFSNGTEKLCEAKAGADGVAQCEWTPEKTGIIAIRAAFAGDEKYLAAKSAEQKVQVVKALPKPPKELSVSPTPVTSTKYTTISGKASPGGFIEALAPGGNRCVATADSEGVFSCVLGYLPAGAGQEITVTEQVDGIASKPTTLTVDVDTTVQGSSSSSRILLGILGLLGALGLLGVLGDMLRRSIPLR